MTALYVPPTDESDHKKQNQSLQLIGGVVSTNTTNIATNTTNIATNTASIAAHEAAWTSYTPTITALSGSFTTTSASGKYLAMGKTVFIRVSVTITTVGTGQFPQFTLPVAALDIGGVILSAAETGLTAKSIVARYSGSGATILLANYDNTNPAASGAIFKVAGVYEAA